MIISPDVLKLNPDTTFLIGDLNCALYVGVVTKLLLIDYQVRALRWIDVRRFVIS